MNTVIPEATAQEVTPQPKAQFCLSTITESCNLGRSHAIRRYCNLFHIRDGITESREFNDPRQTAASRRGHGRQRKNMASVHPSRRFLGMCAPGRKGIG